MIAKTRMPKMIKSFGVAYILLNFLMLIVMCIFAIRSKMTVNMSPGVGITMIPLIGIFSGYWMRKGKFGWWRTLIILVSLMVSACIIFIAIFIAPEMEKIKQNKLARIEKISTSDVATQKMFTALYDNDLKMARQLLEKVVNVNAKDEAGQTPLHIAQDIAIIKLLIQKGANVNAVDNDNMTPIFNKTTDLSKILVAAGADIHHRSNKGNTPLIFYSYSGYIEGIQYLVSLGESVNAKNVDGQTAYDIAEEFGHLKLIEYLKSVGALSGKYIQ